ncbi:hypothetical protein BpHYR1_025149 [Brachionus plicatilis]|uniref:Uncharacterized protein n=1 Tax=Brachionus plicatilis TaxID=10195 RepID=A0A3M7RU89_BRAPC|nr:hypothetical protein BpHYR1_025149 [Brachionus plicatilis]
MNFCGENFLVVGKIFFTVDTSQKLPSDRDRLLFVKRQRVGAFDTNISCVVGMRCSIKVCSSSSSSKCRLFAKEDEEEDRVDEDDKLVDTTDSAPLVGEGADGLFVCTSSSPSSSLRMVLGTPCRSYVVVMRPTSSLSFLAWSAESASAFSTLSKLLSYNMCSRRTDSSLSSTSASLLLKLGFSLEKALTFSRPCRDFTCALTSDSSIWAHLFKLSIRLSLFIMFLVFSA